MSDANESLETQETSESQSENQTQELTQEQKEQARQQTIKNDRMAQFASLLDEKPLDEEGEEGDERKEDKEGKGKLEVKTLSELAKKLGVDQAKLYDVKLTLRDQETNVSLGELKDKYQEAHDLDFERIEWGENKAKQEQELARGRKELEVLVSLVPKESLKKETLEAAAKVVKAQNERQRADVLRRISEWNDEEIRKVEIPQIDEHLAKYGVKLSELTDSRLIHYIRNTWLREQRIEKALAKIKKVESRKTPSPTGGRQDRTRKTGGQKTSPRAKSIARNFLNQLED